MRQQNFVDQRDQIGRLAAAWATFSSPKAAKIVASCKAISAFHEYMETLDIIKRIRTNLCHSFRPSWRPLYADHMVTLLYFVGIVLALRRTGTIVDTTRSKEPFACMYLQQQHLFFNLGDRQGPFLTVWATLENRLRLTFGPNWAT